jgi:hypothetical protein
MGDVILRCELLRASKEATAETLNRSWDVPHGGELGSGLIKSTIQGLRPDRQRPNSFEPACHSGLRYA